MAMCLAALSLSAVGVTAARADTVAFGKSVLSGVSLAAAPTTIQFGPDSQLYVLERDGTIVIYSVARSGPNAYVATLTGSIDLIKRIDNHDDNGALNTALGQR